MSDAKELLLREKGFGFFGAITSSLSHEITNVLAIIHQLSGLLDDFVHTAEEDVPLDAEKLEETTRRINTQVKRGRELVQRLNGFGNTVTDQQSVIVLNRTVEAMAGLCRRFARLRRVELETNLIETSPRIRGNAFELQHIIYRCIDLSLSASREGDTVRVGVEPQDDGARLVFTGGSVIESTAGLESKQELLTMLVMELHGTIETVVRTGQPIRVEVSLPRSLNNRGRDHE